MVSEYLGYIGRVKRKNTFEHAQNADSHYPAHAQNLIQTYMVDWNIL